MSRDEPGRSVGQVLDNILSKIVLWMAVLAAVLTFGLAIMICVSVVMRYFFELPVAWATEFSEYIIFVDVMLATPYVLKIDKHVRVDVLSFLLPKKVQRGLVMTVTILGILACLMTFYYGLQVTCEAYRSGIKLVRIIPVKKWTMMAMVPLMAFFSTMVFIRKLLLFCKNKHMQCDEDYADMEVAKMNPRLNTSASTDIQIGPRSTPDEEARMDAPDELENGTEVQ